uniref:Uncharacterized protein n=1 Tax=Triticum urartu TaxID=4572 RepID=A0A8R7P404_TRIUA
LVEDVGVVLEDEQVPGVRGLDHPAVRVPARHPERAGAPHDRPLHHRAQHRAAEHRQRAAVVRPVREHEVEQRGDRHLRERGARGEPLRAADEAGRRVGALAEHVVDHAHVAEPEGRAAGARRRGRHRRRRAVRPGGVYLVEVEVEVRHAAIAGGGGDTVCGRCCRRGCRRQEE